MGCHVQDPFFKIKFYPPKLWRSVSFSLWIGFERFKNDHGVHFLVGDNFSSDHNRKGGRLSETEDVIETLSVQSSACSTNQTFPLIMEFFFSFLF
jgi:hypothetical protein